MILEPLTADPLGALRNRVVMSAMTRGFAVDHEATPTMVDYYARRAAGGVGLIITEGLIIDPCGDGYVNVPHLATPRQARSWRPVTAAVHAHGARMICQLWHCGRISHPDFTGGRQPVSATAATAAGINRQNGKPYGAPRALAAEEMPVVYTQFARAAALAMEAGFDGVEIHMGHGYLVDSFLDGRINDRSDEYGGSIERRCRFAIELLERVIASAGPERVVVRISPAREMDGPYDWPELEPMLRHLLPRFAAAGLRALDVSCARADYRSTSGRVTRLIRDSGLWPHLVLGGASLSVADAEAEVRAGYLDLVTWGRGILANPDFVRRLERGEGLREFDRSMLATLA